MELPATRYIACHRPEAGWHGWEVVDVITREVVETNLTRDEAVKEAGQRNLKFFAANDPRMGS